jgi:hypothetical protein
MATRGMAARPQATPTASTPPILSGYEAFKKKEARRDVEQSIGTDQICW